MLAKTSIVFVGYILLQHRLQYRSHSVIHNSTAEWPRLNRSILGQSQIDFSLLYCIVSSFKAPYRMFLFLFTVIACFPV